MTRRSPTLTTMRVSTVAKRAVGAIAALVLLLPIRPAAQEHGQHGGDSNYAGLQSREIKSLSEADIEELRRGGGWGLALPAELNGRPGPAHLLELKDEIGLSDAQVAQITTIFEEMRSEAVVAGERLIAAEAALSKAFEAEALQPDELNDLVRATEAARAQLRYVHLSRHLSTTPLLTAHQIQKYNALRGYTSDPCSNVPEGHDPDMWKRHNGCL